MEWVLAPHSGGTPVHVHPVATETYEILAGELEVYVDGVWRTLAVGDKTSVAPGVPHTFRNATGSPTRVYNTHAPAMRFGEYFESIHRIVSSGAVAPGGMTLKAIVYSAVVMADFDEEIRSIRPPQIIVNAVAKVGRLLGYRVPSREI